MTSTPADDGEPCAETGRRPLAMASQGDRGPAYTAAVERSGAAFDHVRRVLGGPVRLVGDAGELAALAAALLPETPVSVGDIVRVAVPGQANVSAVAVTVTTYAGTPAMPVRDERGREYDVLYPGIELGTVLLPGSGAEPGDPGSWQPWRTWDRMADAQDRGEADEALSAIAGVIDLIKDKLADTELSPSGFLPAGSVVPAGIAGAAAQLAGLAEGLRGLAALAAEEARRDLQDDDGTDRIGIAFLTRVTGRAPPPTRPLSTCCARAPQTASRSAAARHGTTTRSATPTPPPSPRCSPPAASPGSPASPPPSCPPAPPSATLPAPGPNPVTTPPKSSPPSPARPPSAAPPATASGPTTRPAASGSHQAARLRRQPRRGVSNWKHRGSREARAPGKRRGPLGSVLSPMGDTRQGAASCRSRARFRLART